jgi:hypothetical protein
VARDNAEHLSDVFIGPVSDRLTLAVTVPAMRDGVVTHALHVGFYPEDLAELLANQHLPDGWIAALLDDQRRVIARTPHVPDLVGKQAPAWYPETGPTAGAVCSKVMRSTGLHSEPSSCVGFEAAASSCRSSAS